MIAVLVEPVSATDASVRPGPPSRSLTASTALQCTRLVRAAARACGPCGHGRARWCVVTQAAAGEPAGEIEDR